MRKPFEEYSEEYAETFTMERRDGIIQVQFRTDRFKAEGGPGGKAGWFDVWNQAWRDVGADPENKVMILTGTGDRWLEVPPIVDMNGIHAPAAAVRQTYLDVVKNTEHFIFGLDFPTIGAVNGPAPLHFESALFCDITLCSEGTIFRDPHCEIGVAPGDGVGMALQHVVNPKQAAYFLYTSDPIDAQTALALGMVNEVLPAERLLPRAWELAERIRRMPDLSRLMAKQIIRRAAQRRHVEDATMHAAHQLLGMFTDTASGEAITVQHLQDSEDRYEAAIQDANGRVGS